MPSRMPDPRWKLQCAINHRRVFTVGAPAEAARPGCCGGVSLKSWYNRPEGDSTCNNKVNLEVNLEARPERSNNSNVSYPSYFTYDIITP
ncbi:hypothetical protein QLX08_001614 [Tetragonisca angustula]|uniref:Uncharacterized protein n=1 Tax=Tetragonisca angustula TaxID=166442 RepID=A0AAW1AED2_9HYME